MTWCHRCKYCNSRNIIKWGTQTTKLMKRGCYKSQQYHCKDCGRYFCYKNGVPEKYQNRRVKWKKIQMYLQTVKKLMQNHEIVTARKVARLMEKTGKARCKVNRKTISRWLKEDFPNLPVAKNQYM